MSEELDSLGIVNALPLAGIFTEVLSDAAALVAVTTGLLGGAARYGAVLAGRTDRDVERVTAFGFFFGFVFGVFILFVDGTT